MIHTTISTTNVSHIKLTKNSVLISATIENETSQITHDNTTASIHVPSYDNANTIVNDNSITPSKIVNIPNNNKRGTEDNHTSHNFIIMIESRSSFISNTTKANRCEYIVTTNPSLIHINNEITSNIHISSPILSTTKKQVRENIVHNDCINPQDSWENILDKENKTPTTFKNNIDTASSRLKKRIRLQRNININFSKRKLHEDNKCNGYTYR